ncbi:membrane protein insertion efficiency factor YidD [Planosporangium thailandense]|uniref:Putative membrane protein insertion efficiency factor n=1 Tax=Planosporangium thailandense TaxID=765197 RepID=A0ABX0Y338_9ACTN|nr:membrane protein insertion efficiency factor YidD [Planosporangium thailandense]NJC72795.1 membrane protein insertion efficiency factor YidD [Planosporangium thailandense]
MRRPRGYYDPRYGDPYAYRGWGRPRYSAGNSCLRDACLLETGCCVAEALDGNCLIAGLLLVPQFVGATTAAMLTAGRRANVSAGGRPSRLAAGLVGAIRVYQREISARRRPCCRFTPSCSEYAVGALQTHGVRRGLGLAARRLLRCRPGGARGADPVPAPAVA